MKKLITVEVDEVAYGLLNALTEDGQTVEGVVLTLIDHAQQGVYRPGAWERAWLEQAFGDRWQEQLESGDPYGRADCELYFQRPIRKT